MPKPDKLTNKILRFMAPKGAECFCSISEEWDYQADISISQLCQAVDAAIEYMVKHDLAGYRTLKSSSGSVPIAFYLKHEGLKWQELRRQERNSFLIKSVLVPILVSLLTSAIVAVASYAWTMAGIKTLNASNTPSAEPMIEETMGVPIG